MKAEFGKKAKKATAVSLAVLMVFGMFIMAPVFAAEKANYTLEGQDSVSITTAEPQDGYRAFKAINFSGSITATLNEVAADTEDFTQDVTLMLTGSYTTENSTEATPIEETNLGSGTMSWTKETSDNETAYIDVDGTFIPKVKGEYDLIITANSPDMEPITVQDFTILVDTKFDDIIFTADPKSGAAVGQEIELNARAEGYDSNILYMFYTEKDGNRVSLGRGTQIDKNGVAWSQITWTPSKEGSYNLIVDAIDRDNGRLVTTQTMNYEVKDWYFNVETDVVFATQEVTIAINDNTPEAQEGVTTYELSTRIDGETSWTTEEGNQGAAAAQEFKWTPNEVGNYTLLVKRYIAGELSGEKLLNVEAKDGWIYKSFEMNFATGVVGIPINVKKIATENLTGFYGDLASAEYKLVYEKDNWATWGIAQDMTAVGGENQLENLQAIKWYPKEVGEYTLYLDIKASPNSETYKTQTFKVTISDKWSYEGVQARSTGNKQVKVSPIVKEAAEGALEGAEYKYVWKLGTATDGDWSSWGVAKQFTTNNREETITLPTNGTYTIYVDIMDISGDVQTRTVEVNV